MKKKICAYFFIALILLNFINPFMIANAAINSNYGTPISGTYDNVSSNSTILNWIAELLYNFANMVETIGGKIMKIFTGVERFPWADKIIFNTIPILDVNYINPASGSLFEDADGVETKLGEITRNAYFTVLSISVGFLSLVIAVIAIRLAISSVASEKAKYKEAIANFLICLVLIFSMHYVLSLMFSVNEILVESASILLNDVLTSEDNAVAAGLDTAADEDNKDIVNAFIKVAKDECFIADIPIVGDMYKGLLDFLQAIGDLIGKAWRFITGQKDTSDTIEKDQLDKIYPNKNDYVNYIKENETRINVAAYLLKNYYYRSTYLTWIKDNDANSFDKGGLTGMGRNILIAVNDVFGVADTGYKALRSLFTSVALITYQEGETSDSGKKVPFDSTGQETKDANDENYDKLSDEQKEKIDKEAKKNQLSEGEYYFDKITSTEAYIEYIDNLDVEIGKLSAKEKSEDRDGQILALNLDKVYAQAYYKYVYDGDDKVEPEPADLVSELGEYFKNTSWYVDTANGDWAPTSINVISAILYGIFVVQSLLIFISYMKRFFYVVILSMFGPVVVLFDYVAKSI